MKQIVVIHGPNLNLLGEREPEIYGHQTLNELNEMIVDFAKKMDIEVRCLQSNHEGELIDFLHEARNQANGIVINPGALSHYSYALRDAIAAVGRPAVEVHLSDIQQREDFRKTSVTAAACRKQISGNGAEGYLQAIEYLAGLHLVAQLEQVIGQKPDFDQSLKTAVQLFKDTFPKYTWVGIYLTKGDKLELHNYIGKPTPHTVIPIGEGICGAAVREEQSIIVPDVNADPRYLACSVETRSEMVVPIRSGDKIVGEIDIDSDFEDSFHAGDQEILEKCADVLSGIFK